MIWHVIVWWQWYFFSVTGVYRKDFTITQAKSTIIKRGKTFFPLTWIIRVNESMMALGTETLSTIKLRVFKLLKWEALKEGSLCLSSVIDFLSAISKLLLLPHSLYLCLSVIPLSLSPYPLLPMLTTSLSHPSGLSSLIKRVGSMKNKGMLMFSVRSLLHCAHACLPGYSSFYLQASPPVCQFDCRWPQTSRV